MIYDLFGSNRILVFLFLCPLQTALVHSLTVLTCSGTVLGRFKWDLAGRAHRLVRACACVLVGWGLGWNGTCFQQAVAIGV